jgi:hypothetical protein
MLSFPKLGLPLLALALWAQPEAPRDILRMDFPADAPVAVDGQELGPTRTTTRGSAQEVDLHTTLILQNRSRQRIRGITLVVTAQQVSAGGRATVTVPSLNAQPGDRFPVRIDLRLFRPLQAAGSRVEVSIDGVLFDSLAFYGPNRLNSRRHLSVWEMEARRDRAALRQILTAKGEDELRNTLLLALETARRAPRAEVQALSGPASALPAVEPVALAFQSALGAPVELSNGRIGMSGSSIGSPTLQVNNRSGRAITSIEVDLLVRDEAGKVYFAGSMPLAAALASNATAQLSTRSALRLTRSGSTGLDIRGVTGLLGSVEFADGTVWVPRSADPRLGLSGEAQRLAEMLVRKGPRYLVDELKRYE